MLLERKKYIERIAGDVIEVCKGTTLFPSVMLAQAAVESANGTSKLTVECNNHFGIKAGKIWNGRKKKYWTFEDDEKGIRKKVLADFRVYDSDYDGFRDRIQFLMTARYKKAREASTPEQQIIELKKAGYATDINYVQIVTSVLKPYNLYQYDQKKKS